MPVAATRRRRNPSPIRLVAASSPEPSGVHVHGHRGRNFRRSCDAPRPEPDANDPCHPPTPPPPASTRSAPQRDPRYADAGTETVESNQQTAPGPGRTARAARAARAASTTARLPKELDGTAFLVPFDVTTAAASFRSGDSPYVVFDERRPVDMAALAGRSGIRRCHGPVAAERHAVPRCRTPPERGRLRSRSCRKAGGSPRVTGSPSSCRSLRLTPMGILTWQPNSPATSSAWPTRTPALRCWWEPSISLAKGSSPVAAAPNSSCGRAPGRCGRTAVRRDRAPAGADWVYPVRRTSRAGALAARRAPRQRLIDAANLTRRLNFSTMPTDALLRRAVKQLGDAAGAASVGARPEAHAAAETLMALGLAVEAESLLRMAAEQDPKEAASPDTGAAYRDCRPACRTARRSRCADGSPARRHRRNRAVAGGAPGDAGRRLTGRGGRVRDDRAAGPAVSRPDSRTHPAADRGNDDPGRRDRAGGATAGPAQGRSPAGLRAGSAAAGRRRHRPGAGMLDALADGHDQFDRARAAIHAVELRLATRQIDKTQAADALDKLLYAWRGDASELALRERVAELRAETGAWRAGAVDPATGRDRLSRTGHGASMIG